MILWQIRRSLHYMTGYYYHDSPCNTKQIANETGQNESEAQPYKSLSSRCIVRIDFVVIMIKLLLFTQESN